MGYFKKYKFDKSQFKLGLRTFKTGIAVFLVLLIFGFFGWKGLQIGALTAVFSLRESFDKSVHFGTSRILGNSIWRFLRPCLFPLKHLISRSLLGNLTSCSDLHHVNHYDNVAMNNKAGVIGGCSSYVNHYLYRFRVVKRFCTYLRVYQKLSWEFLSQFL